MTLRVLAALLALAPGLACAEDDPTAPTPPPLKVPSWVKPGVVVTYRAMDSIESDDPKKPGSAGMGHARLAVMAVLPDAVLVERLQFSDSIMTRRPYFTGGATHRIGAKQVAAGEAFWRLPAALKLERSEGVQTVQRGPFPLNGKQYPAVLLQSRLPNFVATRTYEAATGLLLRQHIASGRPRRAGNASGVNLKSQSSLTFVTRRTLDLPWFKAAPPAWTRTVQRLVYRGTVTQYSVAGMPPVVVPRESRYVFKTRVGAVHAGVLTTRTLPNRSNMPANPQQQPFFEAPAKRGPLWIAPQVLAALQPGRLDVDPVLTSTLTYAVQQGNLGKLGVLTERHPSGSYQVVLGYDLTTGALTYVQVTQQELKTVITMTLAERK